MALQMPRPFSAKSGTFYLNVRIPADLSESLRGSHVTLPVAGTQATVKVTDKVYLSLKTKDPAEAKKRFLVAFQSLSDQWDAHRQGPKPLTHRQIVALAGESYFSTVERLENDPAMTPEAIEDWTAAFGEAVAWYQAHETNGDEPAAQLLAAIEMGAESSLAFTIKGDSVISYEQGIEAYLGEAADNLIARHGLNLDRETRQRLLREMARLRQAAIDKFGRNLEGDYSPDPIASTLPVFEKPEPDPAAMQRRKSVETLDQVFEAWIAREGISKAESTVRRYRPSITSLATFLSGRAFKDIVEDDIWNWAEHRRDQDGIAPATVNKNDLVAVKSLFTWATTRDGQRRRPDNPAKAVRLTLPKKQKLREKTFLEHEIIAILTLARNVEINARHPRASASRRWAPWICAYSGARIQEPLWLKKKDVCKEAGVWVMKFSQTKDGYPRTIPVHEHLIAEGFIEFCQKAPDGFLFVEQREIEIDPATGQEMKRSRTVQEQRASQIGEWIRAKAALGEGVSPNHGWRHTFATTAEGAGISKRTSNAITGHNRRKDASDGYVAPPLSDLVMAMKKIPRHPLSG